MQATPSTCHRLSNHSHLLITKTGPCEQIYNIHKKTELARKKFQHTMQLHFPHYHTHVTPGKRNLPFHE